MDHLWFILFLFIISVAALGVILLGRRLGGLRLNPYFVSMPGDCSFVHPGLAPTLPAPT